MADLGFVPGSISLNDRFGIPPFSVLDARQGYWQDRKRRWIALGIRSELGRGEQLIHDEGPTQAGWRDRPADAPYRDGFKGKGRNEGDGQNLLGMSGATDAYRKSHNDYRSKGPRGAAPGSGKGGLSAQYVSHDSTPAPVGEGGLSDQLAPNRNKGKRADARNQHTPWNLTDQYERENKELTGDRLTYDPEAKKKRKADARAFGLDMMRGEGAEKYDYVKDRYGHRTDRDYIKADDAVIPTGTGPAVFSDGAINPYLARSRQDDNEDEVAVMGTSIFDPVLCELVYSWFCPAGGRVLDPCAGGSVRGVVAAMLGRNYVGIDLRPEQVAANEKQWERIKPKASGTCRWITGDGRDVVDLAGGEPGVDFGDSATYDLILTCPPYFDLERYSYDPNDLSNAPSYNDFLKLWRDMVERSCSLLANNRFAVVVVGDIRDKEGFYRNFPAHTISIFQKHGGMKLYNQAVLVTAVGSLPVRVPSQFPSGRKLGKTHQDILVFYKGDPRKIRDAMGVIEMGGA